MSELRIVRGMDIALYADDEPLFGVTAFRAAKKNHFHEVHEYLSSVPCERIAQNSSYELQLKVMALFDNQLPNCGSFTLRVTDSDDQYIYYGCRVVGQATEMKGNTHAVEVISIEADDMEKRTSDE